MAHNERDRMRAKLEVTQRIGPGGPDESVVRPHDRQQAWAPKVPPHYDLPCTALGMLRAGGNEHREKFHNPLEMKQVPEQTLCDRVA